MCEQGQSEAAAQDTGKAHDLLTDLAACIQVEARDGLNPKGHPDCKWATDLNAPWEQFYPAEWTCALGYLQDGEPDEQRAFEELASLLHKIDADAIKGAPLCSNYREWRDGGFPPQYCAAKAYVDEQMAKQERELFAA